MPWYAVELNRVPISSGSLVFCLFLSFVDLPPIESGLCELETQNSKLKLFPHYLLV
jgi:hypothetical protein